MATVKFYLKRGTTLSRGVDDRQRDQGRIRAIVTGLNNTSDIRKDALAAVYADDEFSKFHNEVADLPLALETVLPWGRRSAYVDLLYARGATADPTQPAFDACERQGFGIEKRGVWSVLDTTDGSETAATTDMPFKVHPAMIEGEPQPLTKTLRKETTPHPKSFYIVSTVLDFDPRDSVKSRYYTYNASAVKLGGLTCAPGTLLFTDCRAKSIDTADGIRWLVQYVFVYVSVGFEVQTIIYLWGLLPDETLAEDGHANIFYIKVRHRYGGLKVSEAEFIDQFPVHGTTPNNVGPKAPA